LKKLTNTSRLYYHYLRRTGLFSFLAQNLMKLGIFIAVFLVVGFFISKYVISTKEVFELIVQNTESWAVFLLFTISETILGLIPPDLFIIWTKSEADTIGVNPWLLLSLLATLSYIGGVLAYYIGKLMAGMPKVHFWVSKKYKDLFVKFKKWGGFLVVVAALLPIPFSIVTLISGVSGFSSKRLLTLGLFRYIRFFAYALVLFLLV